MLSNEDKKDVSKAFGKKVAGKVSSATNDSKSKALGKAKEGKTALNMNFSKADLKGQKEVSEANARYRKHLTGRY